MVLAVTGIRLGAGCRRGLPRDAVLITDDGPEVLTTSPSFGGQAVAVGIRLKGDAMSKTKRPTAEEIILYEKDPKTKIATITFNRPEYLNAPTSDARLRYADLLRAASVDNDVKVVVIRGVGDNLGSGADLPEFMEGVDEPEKRAARAQGRGLATSPIRPRAPSATAPPISGGTPTCRRATGRCRSSRRSASSRPRATATAGTSTNAPTPIW